MKHKKKFKKKIRLWRLKEGGLSYTFKEKVEASCNVNEDWVKLKTKLINPARNVCGYTKGKPRHSETWW